MKPSAMFNSTWAIHEAPNRGSYNYRGDWGVIDHVIVSQGLLDDDGFKLKPGSTTEIRNEYQMYRAGTADARPNRTYGGDRYYGGYSDHLPVVCVIEN
jgi:hypothetical protein